MHAQRNARRIDVGVWCTPPADARLGRLASSCPPGILHHASLGRRLADVASTRPVAQRMGDGPLMWWTYVRRSSVPERACQTRRLQTVYDDRFARYCTRNPVAVERLMYGGSMKAVTYRSDRSDGPTAGTETVDPIEFLARVLVHIPDKGHVTTRYSGWYANHPRHDTCPPRLPAAGRPCSSRSSRSPPSRARRAAAPYGSSPSSTEPD